MKLSVIAALMATSVVCACSKQDTQPAAPRNDVADVAPAKSAEPVFPHLVQFKDGSPWSLVTDERVGRVIKSLVPQSQLKCMDDVFNYMQDLELRSDNSLLASASGSHAENYAVGYISVAPGGDVHVAIVCGGGSGVKAARLQYFTNSREARPPKEFMDWVELSANQFDTVVRSDGKVATEKTVGDFFASVEDRPKPVETNPPAPPAQVVQQAKPAPQPAPQPQVAQQQPSRPREVQVGDKVTAYGNNLADQLDTSYPACAAYASSLRMVANSGTPGYVRLRQLDSMLNRVPDICVGLR